MATEEELEKIENYLLGNLSKQEYQQVKEQIATDADFAKKVAIQQDMMLYLKDTKALELNMQLEQLGTEYAEKNKLVELPKPKKRWYWLVAASLLILIIGWRYFYAVPNAEELFATHYETYVSSELARTNDTSQLTVLEQGIVYYNEQNYSLAMEAFLAALEQKNTPKNNHTVVLFYLSMTYLENDNYLEAEKLLKQITTDDIGVYTQQAYWYLGLIELKNGELVSCKNSLEQVIKISDKGKYATQAKDLLNKL